MSMWSEPEFAEADLMRLGRYIEAHCGIRLPPGKHVMLRARVSRRLKRIGAQDFTAYCNRVMNGDEAELASLVDVVSTNKTAFFREPRHFDYLTAAVLPSLGRLTPAGLRIWSAACSSGEEPWTLAMVLADYAEHTPGFHFQVTATDISTEMLREAQNAVYDEAKIEPVPMPLRKKYLMRRKDGAATVRIVPGLRALVRFARINLLERDYRHFGPMEVIFCRNVFIYFERSVQRDILLRFVRTLVPGGYLILGHSESINGLDVPLQQVAPTVYRKGDA